MLDARVFCTRAEEKKFSCRLSLDNISYDTFCTRWQDPDRETRDAAAFDTFTFGSLKCKAHADADAHSSFSPLLSNLGHILCGRLGHTIPLGFEGIWWTSGPSLNLNIWITEWCVNKSLCLTLRSFSFLKLNRCVPGVSFFPLSVYSFPRVYSSRALTSHPVQHHLPVSHSFKMYIHPELNITEMLLLSVPLLPLSHTYAVYLLPQWFHDCFPPFCSVAIGIGFYGNSEANDGMYQLTSSLLTANYTLASIDLLVSSAPCKLTVMQNIHAAWCALCVCVCV